MKDRPSPSLGGGTTEVPHRSEARRTRFLSTGLVDFANAVRQSPESVYDVVIVGSGYGGSIAAQQLAGLTLQTESTGTAQPIRVCVLERGSEYLPGMFPSSFAELPGHLRYHVQGSGQATRNHEGLFDLRAGADMGVLVANGLGGGSLINAGVLVEPKFGEFESRLPPAVVRDLEVTYLPAARELLVGMTLTNQGPHNTVERDPEFGAKYPLKFHRLGELATRQSPELRHRAAEITVAMREQPASPASVNLAKCVGCGDCMTGCNVGAKASLDSNLLAQARQRGVEMVTGASVLCLSRETATPAQTGVWVLEVEHTSEALRVREAAPLKLRAHKVILAAGTLGSTEILLRSRTEELLFSNRLGEGFSGNGDNIAAIHQLAQPAHSAADEHVALASRRVGPTITHEVEVPRHGDELGLLIQEFAVPAPLKRLFAEMVTTGHALAQLATPDLDRHGDEPDAAIDPCAVDESAIEHTLLLGLIGHDDAAGVLRLPVQPQRANGVRPQPGTLQIVWPQARSGKQVMAAYRRLQEYAAKAFPGASVIANPLWRALPIELESLAGLPRGPLMTVHPLGGCAMGREPAQGVVDDAGRVFNLAGRSTTCDRHGDWAGSLVVLDGSILPGSLGANPALTISALALRAMAQLVQDWKFDAATWAHEPLKERPRFAAAEPRVTVPPKPTEVAVIERLCGAVRMDANAPYPQHCVLELTLQYEPVAIKNLMAHWGGRNLKLAQGSYLRLFRADDWERSLRVHDDAQRDQHVLWRAELTGTLRFLQRRESSPLGRRIKALGAFVFNRGLRDAWQWLAGWFDQLWQPQPADLNADAAAAPGAFAHALHVMKYVWSQLSRAGEEREFDYQLTVQVHGKDCRIRGNKLLTYKRRANPWRQMTQMRLTELPFMRSGSQATLLVDGQFMAKQGVALLQLRQQQNQPNAWLDMASFGFFMARLLLKIHWWTFRAPDRLSAAPPQRLPGPISGLPTPEVTNLPVALQVRGVDALVRLTRYPNPGSRLAPLAMIHGYSVSGNSFTHPSLQPSAAEYFWHQGRDVWVVDLRTSAGLPTAVVPWSYEEVALVDIPAALLHIKNISGQRVDVLAHCVGAAMLSMAILSSARSVKSGETELGVQGRLTSSQLGILSAFNGDDGRTGPHPTVRHIVLSQKGPLLRYTAANILRAYLMRSLRRWLVPDGYQFRPSAAPTMREHVMDRLLSSVPYPDEDYDVENPLRPWTRTPWTASRHRMDALYARDFSAPNLRAETLAAIDDLFGPINLDTVTQTIHFVRFNCITNQSGRGEFVTLENLARRWRGIPTFAIHGADNGMVDVSTQDLIKVNFDAAAIPFSCKTYPGLGHQDMLIGKTAEVVFRDIEEFLRHSPMHAGAPTRAKASASTPVLTVARPLPWSLERPWIGPRLQRDGNGLKLFALSSPRFGRAKLLLLALDVAPSALPGAPRPRLCGAVDSVVGDSRDWMALALPAAQHPEPAGWLVVVAYAYSQTTLQDDGLARGAHAAVQANDTTLAQPSPDVAGFNAEAAPLMPSAPFAGGPDGGPSPEQINAWLQDTTEDLPSCFVSMSDIARCSCPPGSDFAFALGSCQYPANLLDGPIAQGSLTRMAARLDQLDFAIFAGDQIYADATAGLMDPVRSDERFDLPYETALRSPPMREIMRRAQVHMLIDDHEIVDNWEPPCATNTDAARHADKLLHQGLRAYWKYQRLDSHARAAARSVSYQFDHGNAGFYMLDTRSGRAYRQPGAPQQALMFAADEMLHLQQWLRANKSQLKFIVSPAIVLPRRLAMLNSGQDHASRSDAWEAYPATLQAVFDAIVDEGIDNTVFLSGDEHLPCVARATLSKPGRSPRKIVSIHASGLYSPFPFANSKADDFVRESESFDLGEVRCHVRTDFIPEGHVFAQVSACFSGAEPQVNVHYSAEACSLTLNDLFNF